MSGFFITLIISSVIGSIACALSDTKYEKPIRYLTSLFMITVILSPFGELIKGEFEPILPEVSVDEDIAIDRIVIEAENELKKTISSAVLARFGMAPEKIELEIRRHGDESGETLELLNVCVTVSVGDVDEIKEYLEAMLFVKVEVILNNG